MSYNIVQKSAGSWDLQQHNAGNKVISIDSSGNIDLNQANSLIKPPTKLTTVAATATFTAAANGGRINLLGEVGGDALVTITLPAATGSGVDFEFFVSVVNTSNYVIKVADATDVMDGQIITASTGDSPDLGQPWVTGATSDTITLNGTTTGGASIGDYIRLVDIAANQWAVLGFTTSSGTEATPFSATVS